MKKLFLKGPVVDEALGELYDFIGVETITAKKVKEALTGEDVIFVVNSEGGSVVEASEIYHALRSYEGHTTVQVVGMACSAASFFAMGADRIEMGPTSLLMLHNAGVETEGKFNAKDFKELAAMLDEVDKTLIYAYASRTGKSEEEIAKEMEKTTYYAGEAAVKAGFADGLIAYDAKAAVASLTAGISREGINRLEALRKKKGPETAHVEEEIKRAVEAERARISGIEDLVSPGMEALAMEAKYRSLLTPEAFALRVLKAQKEEKAKEASLGAAHVRAMEEEKRGLVIDGTHALEDVDPREVGRSIAQLVK